MKALLWKCILLWWSMTLSAADAAKQLVVLAGPHETGGGEVNKFFATHASPTVSNNLTALAGWIWPTMEDNEEGDIVASPHHLFDLLVEEQDNASIQAMLLSVIRKAFETSEHGVIIGSLLLDRVGNNPETNYDAVRAVNSVVTALELSAEDVTVFVTYRTPRVDQWASVFTNHFDFELYEDFLCSEESHVKDRRWEWLDTCMNPLHVANAYYEEGYDVIMIDQTGTTKADKDVAHVIGCYITEGQNCDDDWLNGLSEETVDLPPVIPINELGETRSDELEQLFLRRDCYYKTQLDGHSRYHELNSENRNCSLSLTNYYKQFADTDFLLNAIQSQKGCQTSDVNVQDLLAQESASLNDDSIKKLVVFAGPHETKADDIMRFFALHASTNDDATLSPSFNGWLWPDMEVNLSDAGSAHHNIFDQLVSKADDEALQTAILEEVQRNWLAAEKGLILGSALFGSVGSTPYSNYDGIAAVQDIVDKLGIKEEHVAIVLSYRADRVEHWGEAWDNHFSAETYQDFVCSDDQRDKRWEWLDTSMNPFKIARSYFDEGFKVVVMDQIGIADAGLDISHAIACEILEGIICEDGYVKGLNDSVTDPLPYFDIEELSEQDKANLEAMFFGRDCFFADVFSGSHRFHILNDHGIWDKCSDDMSYIYQELADTDFLMNAIQSQEGCAVTDVNIDRLVGSNPNGGGTAAENGTDDDTSNFDDEKKLVIFVGPHETAGGNVTEFLSRFASPSSPEYSESFDGWVWPSVDTDSLGHTEIPDYRKFDVMVRAEVDHDLQEYFIQAIKGGWDTAEKGVVIGALEFDKTGLNPYSGYDPLGVVRRIADVLEIADENVMIVVDYRAPRLEHWSAVYQNHFGTHSYEDFLCSNEDQLRQKRWEYVDTVMNPVKIATAYAEQGWSVTIIDYDGINHANRDFAHVFSCDVMLGVDCSNGWVRDLENEEIIPASSYPLDELSYSDRNELEQAFLFRDCSYQDELEGNSRVQVLYQRKLWDSCPPEKDLVFEQLQSTDLFVALLQSQLSCGDGSKDLSKFLAGTEYYGIPNAAGGASDLAGLAIAVAVTAVLVTVMAFYLGRRRSRLSLKRLTHESSDGIFRDNISAGERAGPYRDDSEDADQPYSVESSIDSMEGESRQTYLRKVGTLRGGVIPGQSSRVGPYRDHMDGRSRERVYSGEDLGDMTQVDLTDSSSEEHKGFEV